jgi:hypothetical protein
MPTDPIGLNRLNNLIANATSSRSELLKTILDPRRNLNDECGYPATQDITAQDYKNMYDREPVANRVVHIMPRECWKVSPDVYEEEDSDTITEFEQAWDDLCKYLRGRSWFKDQEGNPVWEHLRRADELSGIGRFGVLLIGIDDGLQLSEPVASVMKYQEMQKFPETTMGTDAQYTMADFSSASTSVAPASDLSKEELDSMPVYEGEAKQRRKVLFLRAFDESLVQVTQWDSNPNSPRYGQPTQYNITLNDPKEQSAGVGHTTTTVTVHWTRVIHIVDNLGSSEIFAAPRMRPVFNPLLDIQKVRGGSAEMYWRGAFPGLSLETHPQLGGDVDVDTDAVRDDIENYSNGLQRALVLMGMSAKTLAPQVSDPTPQINIQVEAICIQIDVPVRIFKGSERGELSSTQDKGAWNEVVACRQNRYVTPRIIVPFIDRLIQMEALPEPVEGYSVQWQDMNTLSKSENADVAVKETQALAAYVSGQVESLVDPMNYLTQVLGWTEEKAEAVLDAVVKHLEESHPDTSDTTIVPGHIPSAPEQEQQPPQPIKVKEGESLVNPEDGTPLGNANPEGCNQYKSCSGGSVFDTDEVQHAMGTLAAKSLGGPVSAKDTKASIKTLYKLGIISRIEMSADEAYAEASSKKPDSNQVANIPREPSNSPKIKSDRQLRVEADRIARGLSANLESCDCHDPKCLMKEKPLENAHPRRSGRTVKGKFRKKDHFTGGHDNPGIVPVKATTNKRKKGKK